MKKRPAEEEDCQDEEPEALRKKKKKKKTEGVPEEKHTETDEARGAKRVRHAHDELVQQEDLGVKETKREKKEKRASSKRVQEEEDEHVKEVAELQQKRRKVSVGKQTGGHVEAEEDEEAGKEEEEDGDELRKRSEKKKSCKGTADAHEEVADVREEQKKMKKEEKEKKRKLREEAAEERETEQQAEEAEDSTGAGEVAGSGDKSGSTGHQLGQSQDFEVFVRGLPAETDESALLEHFKSCGEVASLSLPTRSTGNCKGFAWLVFAAKKGFKKALALNGELFKTHMLLVEKSGQHLLAGDGAGADSKGKGKGKSKGKGKGTSSEHEVFISNLLYEATEEKLREFLADCGEIVRLHMPSKVAGKCMGFAWVTFKTKEGMRQALDKEYMEFDGRRFKIEKAGQHKQA